MACSTRTPTGKSEDSQTLSLPLGDPTPIQDVAKSELGSRLAVRDLVSVPKSKAIVILAAVAAIEKKSFPSNEALSFDVNLLNKPNTSILYVTDQEMHTPVVAYCVCVRFRRTLLLHKICVAERFRGQGIGKYLLTEILRYAERGGCSSLDLWVDPARVIAVKLYKHAGLVQQCLVTDYYVPGRDGIKMSIQLPRQDPE